MKEHSKKSFLIGLLLLVLFNSYAQEPDCYYDYNWAPTTKEKSSYYRVFTKLKENYYKVEDFYNDGTLQMSGYSNEKTCQGIKLINETTWYEKDEQKTTYRKYDEKGEVILEKVNIKSRSKHKRKNEFTEEVIVMKSTDRDTNRVYPIPLPPPPPPFEKNNKSEEDFVPQDTGQTIYTIVEQMPKFPGGEEELRKIIETTLAYPKSTKKNKVEGKTIVGFVIDEKGEVLDIEIKRSSGYQVLDEEAKRIISSMPKWEPGRQQGKAVSVKYVLPITFRLP